MLEEPSAFVADRRTVLPLDEEVTGVDRGAAGAELARQLRRAAGPLTCCRVQIVARVVAEPAEVKVCVRARREADTEPAALIDDALYLRFCRVGRNGSLAWFMIVKCVSSIMNTLGKVKPCSPFDG
jgi:hypothetical protein